MYGSRACIVDIIIQVCRYESVIKLHASTHKLMAFWQVQTAEPVARCVLCIRSLQNYIDMILMQNQTRTHKHAHTHKPMATWHTKPHAQTHAQTHTHKPMASLQIKPAEHVAVASQGLKTLSAEYNKTIAKWLGNTCSNEFCWLLFESSMLNFVATVANSCNNSHQTIAPTAAALVIEQF